MARLGRVSLTEGPIWEAAGNAPSASRIVYQYAAGWRFELVDASDRVVGAIEKSTVTLPSGFYQFRESLRTTDADTGEVMLKAHHRGLLRKADGFELRGGEALNYLFLGPRGVVQVMEIRTADDGPVMTLRWLPPVTWYAGVAGLTRGEALVHPGHQLSVDSLLLVAVAFAAFTRACTRGESA
jgi:hypothetical protein